MKKKILLTSLIVLSSIGMANAVCTPPTTLKCECQHPVINSAGELACGTSYCGDKKCMPDGSCCPEANFCQVGNDKYCCSESQTCDTTSGCVEAKADIETLCASAQGTIVTASSGTFCKSKNVMSWFDADAWCQKYGMTMPTIKEMCPSWAGVDDIGDCAKCHELDETGDDEVWSATSHPYNENMLHVELADGGVFHQTYRYDYGYCCAFCR